MNHFLHQHATPDRRRVADRRQIGDRREFGSTRRQIDAGRLLLPPGPIWAARGIVVERRGKTEEALRVEALLDLCESLSSEDTAKILHDLREHQVELELRNEELARSKLDLEAARTRYADLYDQAPVGYCSLDSQGRITEANPRFAALLGEDRAVLLGRPLSGFILPSDLGTFDRLDAQLAATDSPQSCELQMMTAKATPFWALLECQVVVKNRGDRVVHLVVADVSERRKLEAENRQLQKAESLGRMAGAIAHLFNNQLQVVMGSLDLLGELPPGVNFNRCLTCGKQATERAAEVSRLLMVYLGKGAVDRAPRFLSGLCRESLVSVQCLRPENVALKVALPAPGPVINAHPELIQQVIVNLVTNAWEATSPGQGSVCLTLGICAAADIPSAHRFPVDWQVQDPEYACLEVADTGVGILETDIEKLFDPFFTTKFAGRGLGLSVVLGIVHAHGAVVAVESRRGEGSVFRIYFPLLRDTGDGMPPE